MARRRPHAAWIVLVVTFFALLAGAGIRATPSVLIVPLEEEFGWSRWTICWSSRWLLAWYYALRGLSLFFLPFALAGSETGLWVFAVWYGLDWIATVPPTLRLATNAFGAERAPIMFG
jgi:hypothetical protein